MSVIAVEVSPTLTGIPPSGVLGQPYSHAFTRAGQPDSTLTVTAGALPAGLALTEGGALRNPYHRRIIHLHRHRVERYRCSRRLAGHSHDHRQHTAYDRITRIVGGLRILTARPWLRGTLHAKRGRPPISGMDGDVPAFGRLIRAGQQCRRCPIRQTVSATVEST
ncbi:hypothetical protein AS032_26960 [Rhodococcus qingshengii]|nr:hypothetical protein AOT96_31770 [Rhodococcus sp. 008]KSU70590.1 hypothetical protein AS032_26960 [Rhodococcus qingshengii]